MSKLTSLRKSLSNLLNSKQKNGCERSGQEVATVSHKGNSSCQCWLDTEILEPRLLLSGNAPTVVGEIPDQTTTEDAEFSYSVSVGTFNDPEDDALTYSASLADDSSLPNWLGFVESESTEIAGIFTGTPTGEDLGTIDVKVTASDGGNAVSDVFTLTVNNNAPTLNESNPVMQSIAQASTANMGQTVSEILYSSLSDVDIGDTIGMAITAASSNNGAWSYSTDDGDTWTGMPTISSPNAFLLTESARVRFTPSGGTGTETLTYHLWDQTSGTEAQSVDVSVTGGSSAFSTASEDATINIVNEKADAIDELRAGYLGLYSDRLCKTLQLDILSNDNLITFDSPTGGYTNLTETQVAGILAGTLDMSSFEIPFMEDMARSGMNTLILKTPVSYWDSTGTAAGALARKAIFEIIKNKADGLGIQLIVSFGICDNWMRDALDTDFSDEYSYTWGGVTYETDGPSPFDGWGTDDVGVWDVLLDRIGYFGDNDLADAVTIDWEMYGVSYTTNETPSSTGKVGGWVVPHDGVTDDYTFSTTYEIGQAVKEAAGDIQLGGLDGDFFLSHPGYFNTYLGFMAGMQTDDTSYLLFTERTYNGDYESMGLDAEAPDVDILPTYRLTFGGYELTLEEFWDQYSSYFGVHGLNVEVINGLWLGTNSGSEVTSEIDWYPANEDAIDTEYTVYRDGEDQLVRTYDSLGEDDAIALLVEYGQTGGGYWIYGMTHLAEDGDGGFGPWVSESDAWLGLAEVSVSLNHSLELENNTGQTSTEITHDSGLGEWTDAVSDGTYEEPVTFISSSAGFKVDVESGKRSYVTLDQWGDGLAPCETVSFSWDFKLEDISAVYAGTDILEVYIGGNCILYVQVRKVDANLTTLRIRTSTNSGLTASTASHELTLNEWCRITVQLRRGSASHSDIASGLAEADGSLVLSVDGQIIESQYELDNYDQLAGTTNLLKLGRIWNYAVGYTAFYDNFKVSFSDESTQGAGSAKIITSLTSDVLIGEVDLKAMNSSLLPEYIEYKLETVPAKGDLYLKNDSNEWIELSPTDLFTQDDINNDKLKYTPDDSSAGWTTDSNWDSFTFSIEDETGSSVAPMSFVMTLDAPNSPPVIDEQQEFALPHSLDANTLVGTVAFSDTDVSDTHEFEIVAGDDYDMFYINSSGQIKLNGGATDISADTPFYALSIEVRDNYGYVDRAVVEIRGSAPIAIDRSYTTYQTGVLSHCLQATGAESGEMFTYSIVDSPSHGDLVLTIAGGNAFTYDPDDGFTGVDTFTFKVNDGVLDSNIAECTITVWSNNAPTLDNAIADQTATLGVPFSFLFAANTFSDPDSDDLSYSATLEDDSELPAWLSFDSGTRTFSGTPTSSGTINIKVIASDGKGGTCLDVFSIVIT